MENNRINSKFQKAQGGNWGGPRKHEKHLRVDKVSSDRPEVPKVKGSKKYKPKKERKPLGFRCCPFCQKELPTVVSEEQARIFEKRYGNCVSFGKRMRGFWSRGLTAKKCPNCKAREVYSQTCPCCKRDTWFKDGIYKHQSDTYACGFVGKRKT